MPSSGTRASSIQSFGKKKSKQTSRRGHSLTARLILANTASLPVHHHLGEAKSFCDHVSGRAGIDEDYCASNKCRIYRGNHRQECECVCSALTAGHWSCRKTCQYRGELSSFRGYRCLPHLYGTVGAWQENGGGCTVLIIIHQSSRLQRPYVFSSVALDRCDLTGSGACRIHRSGRRSSPDYVSLMPLQLVYARPVQLFHLQLCVATMLETVSWQRLCDRSTTEMCTCSNHACWSPTVPAAPTSVVTTVVMTTSTSPTTTS